MARGGGRGAAGGGGVAAAAVKAAVGGDDGDAGLPYTAKVAARLFTAGAELATEEPMCATLRLGGLKPVHWNLLLGAGGVGLNLVSSCCLPSV